MPLPPDSTTLLKETISHLMGTHYAERGKALREWKFQMHNQGTFLSSMNQQGVERIYAEAFEKHANRVWNEMQRVLEQTGFQPYAGCENDLADLLKTSLEQVCEADKTNLQGNEMGRIQLKTVGLDFRFKIAVSRLTTEIKIFCQGIRHMKNKEKGQASMQVNYLTGANSRVNNASIDLSINVSVAETEVFVKLREAIEGQISDTEKKQRLLQMVAEGENLEKKTDLFNNWFTRFLSLAADSISVVQPFVPALTQMLAQAT